jgi:hypothetical protein
MARLLQKTAKQLCLRLLKIEKSSLWVDDNLY